MENNLRELLDKIYELEGLVHLSLKHDNDVDDLLRLISKKGNEIATLCQDLNLNFKGSGQSEKSVSVIDSASLDSATSGNNSEKSLEITDKGDIPIVEYNLDEDSLDFEISEKKTSSDNKDLYDNKVKGKPVFSINERFRFKKELFDNSDIDFNNTLALLASMENYEEAEEYFVNEEGFDLNNIIVAEFLNVIKKYFQ